MVGFIEEQIAKYVSQKMSENKEMLEEVRKGTLILEKTVMKFNNDTVDLTITPEELEEDIKAIVSALGGSFGTSAQSLFGLKF